MKSPLRYQADWLSVAVVALAAALFVVQWFFVAHPIPWLIAVAMLCSLPVAAIAHNHHHTPIWQHPALNATQSYLLTLLYGLPMMSWVMVHNQSHHAHGNQPELDCTSTHNVKDRNDLVGLLLYTPASTGGFWRVHGQGVLRLWRKNRGKAIYQLSHLALLWGVTVALLAYDWRRAVLYLLIPQGTGIFCITTFNFCQHAHGDVHDKYRLTRNFTNRLLNHYLFNAGLHTVHHLQPGLHWSLVPTAHERMAKELDPALNQSSFWRYFVCVVGLGTFSQRFASVPLYEQRTLREPSRALVLSIN